MMHFVEMSLPMNIGAFAVLAGAIWLSGTRLTYIADALGMRLGVGHALMGLVFLAGLTELPELVTTAAASLRGDAALALNNMFGGITMQTAILAVVDALAFRVALTAFPRKPTVILEGSLLILLLSVTLVVIELGDKPLVANVGLGVTLLVFGYLVSISILKQYDSEYAWRPVSFERISKTEESSPHVLEEISTRMLVLQSIVAALIILICGVLLVDVATSISAQSGLGSSFVGATILAATTSLPELSTTIAAVRMHAYTMAISNIFGSNLIMILVMLPADVLYREGAILAEAQVSARVALLFGICVTAIYVIGLLVKKKRLVLGMGIDSVAVLAVYLLSIFVLYAVR